MLDNAQVPVIGFAAWSGAGKTTLLKQIIPLLNAKHLRIGIIKHTHHKFEIDIPGKDSYELRHAGAQQTLIASDKRWALITENEIAVEPDLNEMIGKLDQTELDLILVEGFRDVAFPKIEIYRHALGKPLQFIDDPNMIAIATDGKLPQATQLPVLDLNDPAQIANFIIHTFMN